ncbi:MFS transporter [Streptomyces boninensis]|uniref:MFS transporter n=1 Tax=Streptomyces boninensis TaxID=2039455 RepID=UPI003B225F64
MTTVQPGRRAAADRLRVRKRTTGNVPLPAQREAGPSGPDQDGPDGAAPGGSAGSGGSGPPPPPWQRRLRWFGKRLSRPVPASLIVSGVLHLVWLWFFANSGGDLAAQDAWAEFAGRHPDSAYNLAWYGGMHPVSYSVISPYLMAVLGVRTTMILAGTLAAGVLALIIARCGFVKRPLLPSLWGAFALACNAGSGRVTFALGMLFGLSAIALVYLPNGGAGEPKPGKNGARGWQNRPVLRGTGVILFSALATAGSPVAGLFIEVVAAALFLQKRRSQAYCLAVAPPVMVALSAWLFPFQGVQPMPFVSWVFPLACTAAVYVLVPPEWKTVRIGSIIYGLGTVATLIIPSQVGSNVERLPLIFGGTVLLAAIGHNRERVLRIGKRTLAGLATVWVAFVCTAIWQLTKPVVDIALTTPTAAWNRELAPLVDQLERHDTDAGRVEVVPARSHREASALAPYVNLARGWNRQADTDRHALFYDGTLDPTTYHAWLKRWAVRYVVLPVEDRPDTSATEEAEIVSDGQPYLSEVWSDANWRLYRVKDPTPLAEPPATASRADEGTLVVKVKKAGPVLVRVPFSPWLGLVDAEGKPVEKPKELDDSEDADPAAPDARLPQEDGATGEWSESGKPFLNRNGCLTEAGDWTRLHAPHAGTYHIAGKYQLPRGTACPE